MKISLILATVGRTEEVARCLRALSEQTDRNFEVLLVDQNPDDRLLPIIEEARKHGVPLRYQHMTPPSLSRARNTAIDQADGEIIGFVDDDCWYEPETVAHVRAAFDTQPGADGVVTCWVEQSEARGIVPKQEGALELAAWRRFRGGDASSITLFFKRSLFVRLGGFDERFGVGHWFGAGEETDFLLRALTADAIIVRYPRARVHHHFSVESKGNFWEGCQSARKRARGTGGLYAKHRLGAWVVLRGGVAPVFSPLAKGKITAALRGLFVVVGRAEGFLRWKRLAGI